MNRREALGSVALAIAGSGLLPDSVGSTIAPALAGKHTEPQSLRQPYIATSDGTLLFYEDWDAGNPILFIHGLVLSSQAWRYNMLPLSDRGFRCVAYDRRGHGRSTQPGRGYDYDTLADDLACVINQFDLRGVTLVGHSMGDGELSDISRATVRSAKNSTARFGVLGARRVGYLSEPSSDVCFGFAWERMHG